MISTLLVIFLVVVLLLVVAGVVPSLVHLDGTRPERHRVPTRDGWVLAVWHRRPPVRRYREPVVLCHGLGNNHAFMEFLEASSLALFLSARGFDCWSVDLRGAGESRGPDGGPLDATFDDHLKEDLPALVDYVRAHSGSPRVLWVGHSLGGLLGLAGAATGWQESFGALVTIGSPVFFRLAHPLVGIVAAVKLVSAAGRFPLPALGALGAPLAGRVPAPALTRVTANLDNLTPRAQRTILARTFAPLWRGVMAQIEDWARHDAFRSVDGATDYRAALPSLQLPVLVVGGTVDGLAPEAASRAYFDVLGTPDKQLVLLGRAHGQQEDYGHGDLICGKNAREEVYPHVGDWLERRATPVTAAPQPR